MKSFGNTDSSKNKEKLPPIRQETKKSLNFYYDEIPNNQNVTLTKNAEVERKELKAKLLKNQNKYKREQRFA